MRVDKIKKNCYICEFKKIKTVPCGLREYDLEQCKMKEEFIEHPRLKALFCKWFTLDSERRKAIERYNEIQAI